MPIKRVGQERNIPVLFMIILLSSLSVNLVSPIWPLYISSMGASKVELGYILAVPNAIAAFMNIPGGTASDRYGRRRLNAIGTFLGVFPPLFYILASNWVDLIPWVVVTGLSTGLYMPIRWTIIADSTRDESRAMTYSWMNIAFLLGSTVAPFLGGLIADSFGIHSTFILYFVLMASCFVFSLLLKETRMPSSQRKDQSVDEVGSKGLLSILLIFSVLNITQAIGMGIYGPITPGFVEERFSAGYTDVGILYAVGFGLSSMVVQIPGAKLATRYDRKKIVLLTIIASAPFFGLFGSSRSFPECVILMFLSNAILNVSWPAYQDLMMALTPPARRGLMNGLASTCFLGGMTIGSAMSGVLWERCGMFFPYYLSAAMVLLSVLPIFFVREAGGKAQP